MNITLTTKSKNSVGDTLLRLIVSWNNEPFRVVMVCDKQHDGSYKFEPTLWHVYNLMNPKEKRQLEVFCNEAMNES